MKIQFGGLSDGIHEFGFRAKAGEVGLAAHFTGDVEVDLTLDKTATQMLLKGVVRAEGRFACDRCTSEFTFPISGQYRMCYITEGVEFEGIDPAELQIVPAGSGLVDISDDVRQTVLLAVPLKLLCSVECAGLCPHCGKNLNMGPCLCNEEINDLRWEPLRSLKGSK